MENTFINQIISYNNTSLTDIQSKLKNLIVDLQNINKDKKIIGQIEDLISITTDIIDKNKQNLENYKKENINNNNGINETKMYEFGKYIGELKNDKRDGKGIMYYNEGNKFEGYFQDDKAERGIMLYKDGEIYEGNINDGNRHGKGIFYYNNGDIYDGDFKNHYKEGKGIYYFINGDRYEGDFKNGVREGNGIMYYNNGSKEMGDYINDKKVGKHVLLYNDGSISSANF